MSILPAVTMVRFLPSLLDHGTIDKNASIGFSKGSNMRPLILKLELNGSIGRSCRPSRDRVIVTEQREQLDFPEPFNFLDLCAGF